MFSGEGDGIKNYYSLAWYLEHNEDWLWFEGMNHPDQELLPYTDAQPALAWVLRAFGVGGSTSVGILNLLMLLSIAGAAWVFFLLIKALSGPSWLAVGMAVMLALVSPQIARMAGHYSLAYIFVVPLFVLLIYKMTLGQNMARNSIAFALLGLILGFIHPYMLLMQVMFGGLVWGFDLLRRRIRLNLAQDGLWLGALLLPVMVVQIFMSGVDQKFDRPEDPWGFWVFQGDMRSVFAPQQGALKKLFQSIVEYDAIQWETIAFVGTASLIIGLVGLALILLRKTNLSQLRWWPLILASLVLLFFSFGYPFKWFPSITDAVPFVKNFRVLGRFSWPFVCVFGITGFVLLARASGKWRYGVFILAGLLGLWEAIDTHNNISGKIESHENVFAEESRNDAEMSIVLEALQNDIEGIMSLPYFHVGSERVSKGSDDKVLLNSMKLSYHLGVPLLGCQMSRSSLAECKDHLQLIAPVWYPKDIADRLEDGRWLVILNRAACAASELAIWERADSLASYDGLDYGLISTSSLTLTESSVELDSSWLSIDLIDSVGGEWKSESDRLALVHEYTEVLNIDPVEGEFIFSCWYWNNANARTETAVILERIDPDGNGSWDAYETLDRAYAYSADSIRFELKMNVLDTASSYRILFKQPLRSPKKVDVNHFLFAPIENDVYRLSSGKASINNHILVDYIDPPELGSLESATFDMQND